MSRSSSTSSTVQVTNGGRTKTTTKITSIKNSNGEWVEAEKVVTIEQIDGPLLAPDWARTRYDQPRPYFGDPVPSYPSMPVTPPPGTPWGAPAIWA